jgi:hypothetical protein
MEMHIPKSVGIEVERRRGPDLVGPPLLQPSTISRVFYHLLFLIPSDLI